ncbi:MAG: hypothetical protein IPM57_12175 [Oligoflexia bacterium]|nr:hypothetical protein [Oligoflexia bacterium]
MKKLFITLLSAFVFFSMADNAIAKNCGCKNKKEHKNCHCEGKKCACSEKDKKSE